MAPPTTRSLVVVALGLVHCCCCSALRLPPSPALALNVAARPLARSSPRLCNANEVTGAEAEEARVAAAEKAARLARIDAVNQAQATGGSSILAKLFTLSLLIGVGYFFLGYVFDPSVCEFIPGTKPECVAKLGVEMSVSGM